LNPKRLTAYLDVSKMFLIQDSVGAEQMLMDNIAKAVAVKFESTVLGNAAGAVATQPAGLFYAHSLTSTATTTSLTAMIAMETAVNTSNALMGNLGYITNAAGVGLLKSTAKVSSSDSVMLMEGGQVNGYPVYTSNGVASGSDFTTTGYGIIFGNWADLIIGQWGGYDILVDPYTQAALGEVRIIINYYTDAAASRSASFEAYKIK
jgi:HK97 family phage major capsid protein